MTARSKAQIAGAAPARTKASQAWQQTEDRYRSIYENAVEGIFQSTPGGRFLSLNPALARIYGYDSPQEMIESVTDIARQLYADPKTRLEFTRRMKQDGKVEEFEARHLRKDGSLIWTSINARCMHDARGRVLYYEGFIQDITERKQAEEALRRQYDLVARIAETSPLSIAVVDRDGQITFANAHAEQVLGLTKDRITQRTYNAPEWRITDHEGNPFPDEELPFRRVMASTQPVYDVQHAIEWSDGRRVLLSINAAPLIDAAGSVSGMVATMEDVTARKQAEEALLKNEQQFSLVFDTVGDVIFLLAVEPADCFRFVAVNPAFLSVTGLSREQVVGKRIEEVLPETAHALVIGNYKEAIREKKTVRWEEVSAYPTGTLHGDVAVTPAFDQNGTCTHLVGSVHDLTGIRQAEKALEASEKRLQAIVEHSLDEVSLVTADGTLIWESPTAFRPLGYPPDTFKGRSIFDLFHPDDRVTALQTFSEVVQQSGSSRQALFRLRHQDGTWRWMEGIAINLLHEPDVGAVVINYRDITERKQAGEALRLSMQESAHAHDLLLALSQAAQAVQRARTPQDVYQAIQQQTSLLGYHTTCFECVGDGSELKIAYTDYRHSLIRKAEKLSGLAMDSFHFHPRFNSLYQRVIARGETLYIADAARAVGDALPVKLRRLARPIAKLLELSQSIFTPFIVDEKTFGMLTITGPDLTEMDIPAITAFASQAAIAIHNARLYEQAQQEISERKRAEEMLMQKTRDISERVKELYCLYSISKQITKSDKSVDDVLEEVVHLIPPAFYYPEITCARIAFEEQEFITDNFRETPWKLSADIAASGKKLGSVEVFILEERPIFDGDSFLNEERDLIDDLARNLGGMVERKQAEEALQQSELKYRMLHETMTDAFVLVDMTGHIIEFNWSYREMLGYTEEELLRLTYQDITPQKWHAYEARIVQEEILLHDFSGVYEKEYRRKDGTIFPVELRVSLIRNDIGQPAVMSAIVRDITERKQAEEALRESEAKLKAVFEMLPVGVSILDAERRICYVNSALERILEIPRESLSKGDHENRTYLRPDGTPMPAEEYASVRALEEQRAVHNVETGVVKEDGSVIWVSVSAVPVTFPDWKVVVVTSDITERKQAEEALHESEERYRRLVETLPDGVIVHSQGRVVFANPASAKIGGASNPAELIGKPVIEFVHPDYRELVMKRIQQSFSEGIPAPAMEEKFIQLDGTPVDVQVTAIPFSYAGKPAMLTVINDITERKQAEEALRESEERYRGLVEQAPDMIGVLVGQRLVYLNQSGARLFGAECPEQMLGKTTADYMHPDDLPVIRERARRAAETGEPNPLIEFRIKRLDGAVTEMEGVSIPFTYQGGRATQFIVRDITERKQAEEKIVRQMTNLQTLYDGARRLAESLDLSSLSESVTRTCVDVFGIRLAWIGIAEPDGSVSVMNHYPAHIQYPHTTEERWDDVPRGHGPTGHAIRSAASQVITDIIQAPDYIPWRIAAMREGFCTSAAFPLISRDTAFGVLNLYSDQPGFFTPERAEFFQAYANQAAAALEKGRLFADLQSAHDRLRELSARLVEIEEEQRHEIARELHDSVGQSLTALNINLSIIQDQCAGHASASTSVRLADSVKLVEQVVERIRDVMAELRPPVLDDYGLLPALRWYAEQYTGRTKIRAVILEPQVTIPRLPPGMETALFRISQETLTNIARHAEASQVSLSLDMVDGSPRLTIQDDGIGFDPSQADTGWGLRIMRERAEAVGGKLVIEASPGKGTKVVVDVPLPPAGDRELPEKQEEI